MFLPRPENSSRLPAMNRLWWLWLLLWAAALFVFFQCVASLRAGQRPRLSIPYLSSLFQLEPTNTGVQS
jgi:hypothetical protein